MPIIEYTRLQSLILINRLTRYVSVKTYLGNLKRLQVNINAMSRRKFYSYEKQGRHPAYYPLLAGSGALKIMLLYLDAP